MPFNKTKLLIFIFISLTACVASLYMPTENDAKKYNISLDELQKGRKLYIRSCSSCHNLHLPSAYSNHEWWKHLNKMQQRAKIDDAQKELIAKYLETNAKN
jgi:mono/diheme cytochrome c family protein